ncbi:MAG: DedA family protein [Acidobacteriota bacterium]|nr:DedA family protein [Acidobacteriota bacterium]
MLVPSDTTMLARHGALWMFLVTLGERLGLPVFISPLLLAAGAMVAVNPMQFWLVMVATAVPCLLGDAMWYELGRWKGRQVIAAMCRISFVPDSLEQKAYAGLKRFKGVSLLYAKWIPGVAHLAPPVAGAARLPRLRFHLYNGIGSILWILIMLLAGVLSMRTFDWMDVFERSSKWSIGFLLVSSIPLALYSWWRRRQARERRLAAQNSAETLPQPATSKD